MFETDLMALTPRQRMDRLRSALRQEREPASQELAKRMDRCGVAWKDGRYECRTPSCVDCRQRYIGREQRVARRWFSDHKPENLAFVSVVLEATSEVTRLAELIKRSRNDTRNRMKASRRTSPQWRGAYMAGWHEIDAVAADQIPLLPPQRRELMEQLVPWSLSSGGPAWVATYHGIFHLNGLSAEDVSVEFGRQWPIRRQVHVKPFELATPVVTSLDRIVSYSNKFSNMVHLNDGYVETWPVSWESSLFGWLQASHRNAFEALRFRIGPQVTSPAEVLNGSNDNTDSLHQYPASEGMPWLITGDPMSPIYTGGLW